MKSYRPEEIFDEHGQFKDEYADIAPKGELRMGMNPHANGGILLQPLRLPDFCDYEVKFPSPGAVDAEATKVLGEFLRDVMKSNMEHRNFRVFGPDETASNRLQAIYEVSKKRWEAETVDNDTDLDPDGRVMEVLSEHM